MVFRKKRSHFMRLYLYIKDRIYLHMYFQYQDYWKWLFIFFCINFIAWDIFDIMKLHFVYEYKLYVWTRCLIDERIFITSDILINIMNKHKLLYDFYYNFNYYSSRGVDLLFMLQIYKNIYMFKQVLLIESIDEYYWTLDILFMLSI